MTNALTEIQALATPVDVGYAPVHPDPNVLKLPLLHRCFGEKQGALHLDRQLVSRLHRVG